MPEIELALDPLTKLATVELPRLSMLFNLDRGKRASIGRAEQLDSHLFRYFNNFVRFRKSADTRRVWPRLPVPSVRRGIHRAPTGDRQHSNVVVINSTQICHKIIHKILIPSNVHIQKQSPEYRSHT